MAHGMFRLFIKSYVSEGPLHVASFKDLKHSLGNIASIALVIFIADYAIRLGPGREILELGIGIAGRSFLPVGRFVPKRSEFSES